MARQTSRRRAWIGIFLLLGLVALSAGAWGLQRWAPFADDSAGGEVEWPRNVQPIAEFVEETTGFRFREAVPVTYIVNIKEYRETVNPVPVEPTEAELDADVIDAAAGRALGFWSGDVSLIEYDAAFDQSTPGPVSWIGGDNTITIRASGPTAALDAPTRVELAAALTEVLDEQLFGVVEISRSAETAQEFQVLNGLLVGHALWVRDQYVADLDTEDSLDYYDHLAESNFTFSDEVDDVPVSFQALRASGTGVGTGFVAALARDRRQLEAAFTSELPDALDQLMLPAAKYLRRDPLEPVAAPAAPDGAEVHRSSQLGPVALYMMMTTGIDAPTALTATDGWGNDAYTVYTLDGVVCLDLHVVADSPDDADRLEAGLNSWANRRKDESGALLGRDGVHVYVSVCDPGIDATQWVPQQADVDHLFGRSTELQERIRLTRKPALSECIAVRVYAQFDQDELNDFNFENDITDDIMQIEEDCLELE